MIVVERRDHVAGDPGIGERGGDCGSEPDTFEVGMHHQRNAREVRTLDPQFIRHIGRDNRRHALILAKGTDRRAEQLRRRVRLDEDETPAARVEPGRHGGDHRPAIAHRPAHYRIYLLRSVSPASVSSRSRT